MIIRVFSIILVASTVVVASTSAQPDADELAQRFLEHMESIAPVAGTFTIETRFDPEVREADIRSKDQWAASQGFSLDHGPDEPLLRCEWAWDGERESLETLGGSNVFHQFYMTPEVFADGMASDNYNLTADRRTATLRPSKFYLVSGRAPWSKYLEGLHFSTQPAPPESPDESIFLIARSEAKEVRLLVEKITGRLFGYEIDLNNRPYSRLVVEEYEWSSDGREFPSRARLTIYLKGKPYRLMTLTADRITFRPDEVAGAMGFVLPPGTSVHDRILDRVIPITRPTPVQAVSSDQIAAVRPDDQQFTAPLTQPDQAVVSPSSTRSRNWIPVAIIAVLATVGLWSLRKGARLRDRIRSIGS